MDNVNTILSSIEDIQEAAYLAREDVYEKINDFAEKVAVMEQCGLNVMSEDSTMQFIIENREQVTYDYMNTDIYFDESYKSTIKKVGATLLGVLVGTGIQLIRLNTDSAKFNLLTIAYFFGVEAAWITVVLTIGTGVVVGGLVGNKIHKVIRRKHVGSEIIEDIKSVCRELVRTTNTPDEKDLKKLKSKLSQLIKTCRFALNNRKSNIPDTVRSQLHPLMVASQNIIDRVTLSDTKTNTELLKKFMDAASNVVINIAGITPEEVKAMNEKVNSMIEEITSESKQESGDVIDAEGQILMESSSGKWKQVGHRFVGYLLGNLTTALVFGGLAAGNVAWVLAMNPMQLHWVGWAGGMTGMAIADKLSRDKLRGKGLKGEIVMDLNAVLAYFGKDISNATNSTFTVYKKELKKAIYTLSESLSQGVNSKALNEHEQHLAATMLSANRALYKNLKSESPESNKKVIEDYFNTADELIKEFTGITDSDMKKLDIVKNAEDMAKSDNGDSAATSTNTTDKEEKKDGKEEE